MIQAILGFFVNMLGTGVVVGLAAGAVLAFGWDNRPPNWPNVHVLWLDLGTGEGLAAERDQARAALGPAVAEERLLTAALNRQSASVAALGALGVKTRADAASAVSAYQAAMAAHSKRLAEVSAPLPAGDDVCARVKAADAALVESLP